jgi:hypothetical protein
VLYDVGPSLKTMCKSKVSLSSFLICDILLFAAVAKTSSEQAALNAALHDLLNGLQVSAPCQSFHLQPSSKSV